MRQVSAALRAAIDNGERIVDSVFTIDWDNDGIQDIDDLTRKVESLSFTQSLESNLPSAVQLVPGVAVAELTAKLSKGNTNRYNVPSFFRSLTTSSVGTGSTPTWSVAKPAGAKVGDVILVAIFVGQAFPGTIMGSWQVYLKSNVTWLPMSLRGDGSTSSTRCEGLLLYRRVDANEPDTYTITLPQNSAVTYASAAVNVGDAYLMGVTDFTQKGEDNVSAPTGITLPQVKVDVPNSTIVSFFGAASYAVSGIGFSPLDANDVEQTEITVSAGVSKPSLRMAVTTHSNAPQGFYQKGVTFTGSAGTSDIATIAFSVVLAPKVAGDEAQHAAWTFSELNPNSPFGGKSRIRRKTKWQLRFVTPTGGFETVPLFTGYTTAPSAASDRSATIKAIDNRETMRNTGQGLNIAATYPVSLDFTSGSAKPTMPGLETTWIISRSFFLAYYRPRISTNNIFTFESQYPTATGLGYFPSPLASRYSSIWATMHGSAHNMLPQNSQLQYAYTESANHALRKRVRFETGPFVAATKNEAPGLSTYLSYTTQTWKVWDQGTSQMVGRLMCWVRRNQTTSYMKVDFPDNNGNTYDAWIEVLTTGVVQFRVEKPSVSRTVVGPTIAADGVWHFLGVHFDSVAGSVRFRVDTTNTDVALTTWTNTAIPAITETANITLTDGMQLAELQVAGGFTSVGQTGISLTEPWANENFTPTAFVDKTENSLDAMPFIDINNDTFSVVSDIAAAEFAAFFFDADGYPHYRNSRSDASPTGQTVQRSITSRRSIKSIAYESGVSQIRNIITLGYTPFAPSTNAEIFSASGVIGVLPNTTQTYTVSVQGPIIQVNLPATYTAFSQLDGTGIELTSKVSIGVNTANPGYAVVTIQNNSGSTAYLVNNTGQPNLHITAQVFLPLTGGDSIVTYSDADSIREFGEQPLPDPGASVWVQNEESAASLALKLLSDLCQPQPVITSLDIKGDPTLEFGDLVTVVDRDGLGVNGQYRITSKDPTHSSDGFTQTLVVRRAPSIAFWDTNFWDDGTVWG